MWKDLTLKEKAEIMKMSVANGVTDINDIQKLYDNSIGHTFKDAGRIITLADLPREYVQKYGHINVVTPKGVRIPLSQAYKDYNQTSINVNDVPYLADYLITQEQPDINESAKLNKQIADKQIKSMWPNTDWGTSIKDFFDYTKSYLYNMTRGPKSEVLDLSNSNVAQINEYTSDVGSILFNDFDESSQDSFRQAKDYKSTTDTLIGDRNLPLSNIHTFWGVEDGKLKVGPLDTFNDNTIIAPNRAKGGNQLLKEVIKNPDYDVNNIKDNLRNRREYLENWGKNNSISPSLMSSMLRPIRSGFDRYPSLKDIDDTVSKNTMDSLRRVAADKYPIKKNSEYPYFGVTIDNDTIPIRVGSPKAFFGNEEGNGLFVSNMQKNIDAVNKFLSKTPAYIGLPDNGRYSSYQTEAPSYGSYVGITSNPMFVIGTVKSNGGHLYKGGGSKSKKSKSTVDYHLNDAQSFIGELIASGASPAQAIGVGGNVWVESRFNAAAENNINGGHWGLVQNDANIKKHIIKYYGDYSRASQMRFLKDGLTGQIRGAKQAPWLQRRFDDYRKHTKGVTDASIAAKYFHDDYEKSNNEGVADRMKAASIYQAQMNGVDMSKFVPQDYSDYANITYQPMQMMTIGNSFKPITLSSANVSSPWMDYLSSISQQPAVSFNTPIGISKSKSSDVLNKPMSFSIPSFENTTRPEVMENVAQLPQYQSILNSNLFTDPYLLFRNS